MSNIIEAYTDINSLQNKDENTPLSFLPRPISQCLIPLQDQFPSIDPKYQTKTLLAKTFHSFSTRRIMIDDAGEQSYLNWFHLGLAKSGTGKGRINKYLNETVFKKIIEDNTLNVHTEYKNFIKANENKKIKNYDENDFYIPYETNDATLPGMRAIGSLLSNLKNGSITITMSEYFQFMNANGSLGQKRIEDMLHYYSSLITGCIKCGMTFSSPITNVPINMNCHSDYTLLQDKRIYDGFIKALRLGFARRFDIAFATLNKKHKILKDEDSRKNRNEMISIGDDFYKIYNSIKPSSCYVMLSEAKNEINKFAEKNYENLAKEKNDILKLEIESRIFKAIKLSGLYACLNHPERLEIDTNDASQAIATVEYMAGDLEKLLNFLSTPNDEFEKLFNLLKRNLNQEFSKTDLTSKYGLELGISRRNFVRSYDQILAAVNDIAIDRGYILQRRLVRNSLKVVLKKLDDNYKPNNRLL